RRLPGRGRSPVGVDRVTRDSGREVRGGEGRRGPGRGIRALSAHASRTSLLSRPVAQKIAVLSQKGGTGKTTAVRTLTDVFRRTGLDVLAIDPDPQANLSDYFDVDPEATPTIGDVLAGRAKAARAVHDG